MDQETTVYHLEMHKCPDANSHPLPEGFRITKISPPDPQVNARFYREVGGPWAWRELLVWSNEDWAKVVDRPEFHTWVAMFNGDEVGYFEIEQQEDGDAEIVHFGLIDAFTGRGLGRAMLREAIRLGWQLPGTRRLWLHTCTRDHPGALTNYQRRGFTLYKTEVERKGKRNDGMME
jgi:GNAT superfamily N-acetyltransferase